MEAVRSLVGPLAAQDERLGRPDRPLPGGALGLEDGALELGIDDASALVGHQIRVLVPLVADDGLDQDRLAGGADIGRQRQAVAVPGDTRRGGLGRAGREHEQRDHESDAS